MKKINSVIAIENLSEKAANQIKLSQAEMEDELDHCPASWNCKEACYKNCVGCLQKSLEVLENE